MRADREVPATEVTVRTSSEVLEDQPAEVLDRVDLLPLRAVKALRLGLSPRNPGFHVYVACDSDLMFDRDVVRAAAEAAKHLPAPVDIVYVHDFDRPEAPRPLVLPAGRARELARLVDEVVDNLSRQLHALAATPDVREADTTLAKELASKNKQVVADLEAVAKSLGFGVRTIPGGVQTFPILHGKPVSPEQFEVLDDSTKRALQEAEGRLSDAVEDAAKRIRDMTEAVGAASDDAMQKAAERLIETELGVLREQFGDVQQVMQYVDQMRHELCHDWRDFVEPLHDAEEDEHGEGEEQEHANPEIAKQTGRFRVNVFVEHEADAPPPVIWEANPTFPNLFGYLERRAKFGTLLTDFMRIRNGALSRANGGYLVMRTADLLADPLIWERFKRVLRDRYLAPEDPLGPLSMYATTLRPQAAPLDVRVILVGPQHLYEQLLHVDPDFSTLFRVKVEAEWWAERNETTLRLLDGYLMSLPTVKACHCTFDKSARAKLLDFATRIAGDQERLALTCLPLEEIACFASANAFMAGDGEQLTVTAKDIETAWDERRERSSGIEQSMRDMAVRGELMVETSGTRVGVVNGLSVLSAGDVEFGQPMRITAVVSLGREGVIDVEREAQLGGSLHTKGVAIVRGFLSHMFGQERPLSLKVQIAFEQSYGEIDGDSASASELFTILSALADVGIDQGLAVTGSVNQLGDIQAIGGLGSKIEGFYDIARERGLTGAQGVMMPKTNLRHLVLRPDVTKAIADGRFHLYAVSSVAEGIEVLTGLPAGDRDSNGRFPAGSVFGRVERRLIELAELLREAESPSMDRTVGVEGPEDGPVDEAGNFRRAYDRDW